jgi:hypothetical protein
VLVLDKRAHFVEIRKATGEPEALGMTFEVIQSMMRLAKSLIQSRPWHGRPESGA